MLLRQYSNLVILRVISFGIFFVFLSAIALIMSAEQYGYYSLVFSVVQVVGVGFLSFGNQAFLRFAREEYRKYKTIQNHTSARIHIYILMLVVILPLFWAAFPFISTLIAVPDDSLFFIILAFIAVSINEITAIAAQSTGVFSGFGVAPLLLRAVQLITLLVMYSFLTVSWVHLLIGTLLGYLLSFVYVISRLKADLFPVSRISAAYIKKYIYFGWSIPLASIAVVLMDQVDIWFINYHLGVASVGVYAWVYNVLIMGRALIAPLGALLAPRFIDYVVNKQSTELSVTICTLQSFMAFVTVLVPVVIALAHAVITDIEAYLFDGAAEIMCIILVAALYQVGVTIWYSALLSYSAMVSKGTLVIVLVTMINIIGNAMLIPVVGVAGAAISTAIAILIEKYGLYYFMSKSAGIYEGYIVKPYILIDSIVLLSALLIIVTPVYLGVPLGALFSVSLYFIGKKFNLFAWVNNYLENLGGSSNVILDVIKGCICKITASKPRVCNL